MKYRKIAKDKNGIILQEGDVIMFKDGDMVSCVIDKVVQLSREENPELEVFEVTTDWKGNNLKVTKRTLSFDTYKNSVLMRSTLLNNDTPKFNKIRQLSEKAYNRAPFRRRVKL